MKQADDVDAKVQAFDLIMKKIDVICPEKQIRCSVRDQPWITSYIKTVIRQRKREFDQNVERLKSSNMSSWYNTIKTLGATSGENMSAKFDILEHNDKPDNQICEEIADYFSSISQEYPPLDRELLPSHLNHINYPTNAPIIEEFQVYEMIKKSKSTKGLVPGDIPQKILKEFAVELSVPIANIFNSAIQQGIYPSSYKKEIQVPIPKIFPPNEYNDLRNLSCTMFFSKKLEKIMLDHLLKYTKPYLDPTHYGGFKGNSTSTLPYQFVRLFT